MKITMTVPKELLRKIGVEDFGSVLRKIDVDFSTGGQSTSYLITGDLDAIEKVIKALRDIQYPYNVEK